MNQLLFKLIWWHILLLLAGIIPVSAKTSTSPIDVQHLSLKLAIDWPKKQVSGTAVLTIALLSRTSTITLDAAMLSVHAIQLQNSAALPFHYPVGEQKDQLQISLDREHKTGDIIRIAIDYTTQWVNATDPSAIGGSTGKGIRFFEPSATEPNRRKQVWSMGEGEGNRYWFPCHDVPGDLLTTDFTATVDEKLIVISNGKLISQQNNGDHTVSFFYRMDRPYPNHKIAFVAGEYVRLQDKLNNTRILNYAYPDEKEATAATIERLPDMIRFYTTLTGKPYPYADYTQVFVQELPWGRGCGGFAVQTENMVDDHATHADYLYLWDMLESESLAGQWFGNDISCAGWKHYWLDKSFSRYLSCMYDEYKNGKEEMLLYQLSFDKASYFADWNASYRRPVAADPSDVNTSVNDNYSNSRGALVLHMLRKQLGEKNWHKTIRQYVQTNSGKAVTTGDLCKAITKATGQQLDWFFDQWVYKMGHPEFEVTTHHDPAKKQLTIRVRQTQAIDSSAAYGQVVFFKGKLSIEIDQAIQEVFIEPKEENVFHFSSPQAPQLVNFDYEKTWIATIKEERTTAEWLYMLDRSRDVAARQKAMTELVRIAQDTSVKNKEEIYAGFRKLALSPAYWRLRYNAIVWLQRILLAQPGKQTIDENTRKMLLQVIKKDTAWVRTAALFLLGATGDQQYTRLYLQYLNDKSERVVNAAAIALGKCKAPEAYAALVQLKDKPSWKNQSLISSLNGLKELGDKRAVDFALQYITASQLPHWTLGVAVWDHRLAAAETLAALGETGQAFRLVKEQFTKAVQENNSNDIFYNLLLIAILGDPAGKEIFHQMETRYEGDENALAAISTFATRFEQSLHNK